MKRLAVVLIALALTGCATAYQRRGFSGGYSETQLGENIFKVSFYGNGFTSMEQASDFALLRAAELTLERGFRYFVVVRLENDTKTDTFTTPTTSYTTDSAYGYGNYDYVTNTTTYVGRTFLITRPRSTFTILCFKEKPDNNLVFDAVFVFKFIRRKYNI
jgi:hypothetical protein